MKLKTTLRTLALATLASTALVPTAAEARPGVKPEPLIVVTGADATCGTSNASATANLHQLFTEQTTNGVRTDAAYKFGKTPLKPEWLYTWTYNEGYNQCQPVVNQGRALYNKIVQKIAQWNVSLPADQKIDKVDVVGISLGSLVTRSCIANVGRGNPANETPGCAALVDDWVGIVAPSHGSTSSASIGCPYINSYTCAAAQPGGDFQLKLNERYNGFTGATGIYPGDETPQAPAINTGASAIEYTSYWAAADEVVTPVGSEALWGADNVKVQSGSGAAGQQLDHNNIANTTLCPGSPAYTTSGTWEWLARTLLDVGSHWSYPEESPRQFPTAIAPSSTLNCKSAPPELQQPVPAQPVN